MNFATPVCIAMWSGPRNLSTAMMRSFGSRRDVVCMDEPFYGAFLALTGLNHPLREEILARHETDPAAVAHDLVAGAGKAPIIYQKQMTHHMVDGVPRDWMGQVRNAFLIRHPARVLASYARKMEAVSLEAIGFRQQTELFDQAWALTGEVPVVIDSDRVLADPRRALTALCEGLGIDFDPAMLAWAPGPRPTDGAWAPHWYDVVNASTGFGAPSGALPALPDALQSIADAALPPYERMLAHAGAA